MFGLLLLNLSVGKREKKERQTEKRDWDTKDREPK